ncbi:MAG: hypothetical protein H6658_13550 [Ardenticatenaceae bacterium]|nr:hypothetical protein [Ardenticatenaceae bacterium]
MYFSDILSALRWWLVLLVLGTAVFPLAFVIFRRLPDRGYAFTKMLGLLLVSYLFWISGSLGILGNNLGGVLVSLVVITAIALWFYRQKLPPVPPRSPQETLGNSGELWGTLGQWLRDNRSQIIITELVFAALFALWVWVRAQNPAIAATEKPMEFAFLNSVGRSPTFPPLDPWLSGYAISYYYFGYVMTSLMARLAFVAEPIAFNLGIAWLVAGSGTAAFGLVYNLVAARGVRRNALLLGLMASLALPIAGNLQIILEVLHANGGGSAEFWQWLDVRDINDAPDITQTPRYESSAWWWWRSSRVIHEYHLSGRSEEGLEPIVEFPGFSFVLGDMHPHVLSLPFAFLSLAIALVWFLGSGDWRLETGDWRLMRSVGWPLWLLTAVMLGGLAFLNTWDVLIHLFVVVAAFALGQWQREGWNGRILSQSLLLAVLLFISAYLLYLPFFIGFSSQAGAPYLLPTLVRPTRLPHFLIIFGLPLLSIVTLLLVLAVKQRLAQWKVGLITAVSLLFTLLFLMLFLGILIASSQEGYGRISNLASELNVALSPRPEGPLALGWGITAVFTLLPTILSAKLAYPGVTLLLLGIITVVVMIWSNVKGEEREAKSENIPHPSPLTPHPSPLPFLLLLVLTAALLTLGPEFVYLRDNFGQRLNTMFKFYYQAWVMFGVAGLVAIDYLWREVKALAGVVTVAYTAVFALTLLFPYYAIQSRAAEYRGAPTAEDRRPATLNGLAQVERFNPDEYAAIMWLRQNVEGTPVILEAVGGQYSNYGRIAANTGLPTILGWAGHEYQWRGSDTPEPAQRDPAVSQIYTDPAWGGSPLLLDKYNVQFIYVGGLETSTYGPLGSQKFADQLEVAYQNNSVTIYRWQPQ